jgi:hypothetical protein
MTLSAKAEIISTQAIEATSAGEEDVLKEICEKIRVA